MAFRKFRNHGEGLSHQFDLAAFPDLLVAQAKDIDVGITWIPIHVVALVYNILRRDCIKQMMDLPGVAEMSHRHAPQRNKVILITARPPPPRPALAVFVIGPQNDRDRLPILTTKIIEKVNDEVPRLEKPIVSRTTGQEIAHNPCVVPSIAASDWLIQMQRNRVDATTRICLSDPSLHV
jgi:hypothetical protein